MNESFAARQEETKRAWEHREYERYTFDDDVVRPIAYDDVPAVELARAFMKNPDSFLRHLVNDPERF
jgi:hypothetical protein